MKTWNILSKLKTYNSDLKADELIDLLLENRGIKAKKEKEEFLNSKLELLTPKNVGLDEGQLDKAIKRIQKAINNNEQIVIFGDYDVDGITGSAILWEVLHEMKAQVLPYIPNRIDEGYGLSILGIDNIKNQETNIKDVSLIITVDNGIVAHDAVAYANKKGIDVIITDHHVAGEDLPKAHSIVHTTKLCGAGVAYVLSREIKYQLLGIRDSDEDDIHLELATLGTIADLVPLTNANRVIVKNGLLQLGKCRRLGLNELFRLANLAKDIFSVYDVGYIVAPRLNATGRIESAMDSLRLLCTKDNKRAAMLAQKLEMINTKRQYILKQAAENAKEQIKNRPSLQNLLFVADESYQQGVIGLVAGKLADEYYRPSIVVSIGEKKSKGSARSIPGFNIIEFLRSHKEYLPEVGGHPMAAGFSVETDKIKLLKEALEKSADKIVTAEMLKRSLRIDCELPLRGIDEKLFNELQALAPFGMGNPEPTFVSLGVEVKDFKLLGKDRNHLKLKLVHDLRPKDQGPSILEAIGFGMGELAQKIKPGDKIDIVYTIDNNTWLARRSFSGGGNGTTTLQLKLKDIKTYE
jgi:single-stranded-DNA-specific exonuclease